MMWTPGVSRREVDLNTDRITKFCVDIQCDPVQSQSRGSKVGRRKDGWIGVEYKRNGWG
jgi:hypothetical protein